MGHKYLHRALEEPLQEALQSFPVVVLTGARQTGKSTLVRKASFGLERNYLSLDDLDTLEQARRDPAGLLGRAPRLTIDEVQRSPELLHAIKLAVDEDRRPGRFLLTGSANLLLLQRVSESLAGRARYCSLGPLCLGELQGQARPGHWERFFGTPRSDWDQQLSGVVAPSETPLKTWQSLAKLGGYPTPALELKQAAQREAWFASYALTYLERDLQQLSSIHQLPDFRRLMRASCLRLGNLLNQASLARDVGLAPSTAQRYMDLLEVSMQLVRLPAYSVNRTRRLTKAPKLFWSDSGLALHLAGEETPRGAHLENLILADLLTFRETLTTRPELLYWRTQKGTEVDLVIEWKGQLLPIEVKATRRPGYNDTKGLRVFLNEYPELCPGALLIYGGDEIHWLSDRILALPWWAALS